jgi:cobyrinic acid a,c-diamide synthase
LPTSLARLISPPSSGLGKTLQAIGIMAYYREHLPALIIVPASLRFQ